MDSHTSRGATRSAHTADPDYVPTCTPTMVAPGLTNGGRYVCAHEFSIEMDSPSRYPARWLPPCTLTALQQLAVTDSLEYQRIHLSGWTDSDVMATEHEAFQSKETLPNYFTPPGPDMRAPCAHATTEWVSFGL